MTDLDFINEYRKLKNLNAICKEVGSDRGNLVRGREKKNESLVAKICKCEIIKLYNLIIKDSIVG